MWNMAQNAITVAVFLLLNGLLWAIAFVVYVVSWLVGK